MSVIFRVSPAKADSKEDQASDGLYHRFSGDLAFDVSAGGRLPLSEGSHAGLLGRVGTLYLASVGAFVAVDRGVRSSDQLGASLGVEVRPLFVPRFSTANEIGSATADLLIDSLSLSIASRWVSDHRSALELGTGIELPLTSSYAGPFLSLRYSHVFSQATMRGHEQERAVDGNFLTLTFGWRGLLRAHVVDVNDLNVR